MQSFILKIFSVVALCCLYATVSWAQLTVQITKGNDDAVSIAVVPFAVDKEIDGWDLISIDQIVTGDLTRSGQFKPIPLEDMLSYPSQISEVYYRDWRILGVQYLIFGRVIGEGEGVFNVQYSLVDIFREQVLLEDEAPGGLDELRSVAHYVSDTVYEKITGIPGAYSTKFLYVVAEDSGTGSPVYQLKFSDSDGARQSTLYQSNEPLLSPSWSPDGRKVAYVSFETGKGTVVVQNLVTGQRQKVVESSGRTSAPEFSPDATKMVLVLSTKGNPDLYIKDLVSGDLKQITKHYRIDTEPSWMPDGKSLIFTSNRSGNPQIYQFILATGATKRLTFQGNYNAHGQILPNGKSLVFVHRNKEGVFQIATMDDIAKKKVRVLTETTLDESPSVAPNGTMLVYATQDLGKEILAVMSLDGRMHYKLPDTAGNAVREPAWSPFL